VKAETAGRKSKGKEGMPIEDFRESDSEYWQVVWILNHLTINVKEIQNEER